MTLVKLINSILEIARKTTTYKFATLLSIFDYVIDHPEEEPINNFHFIPIIYLARQFFSYYYPLSYYDFSQGTSTGLAIYSQINKKLKNNDKINDKLLLKSLKSRAEGIVWINQLYDSPDMLPEILVKLLWDIRGKIIDQPLHYISNIAGTKRRFFGIINKTLQFDSTYEVHREKARKQLPPNEPMNWLQIFMYDQTSLIIDDLTYKELARFRFWIRDVILKKWFEFSHEIDKNKGNISYDYGEFFNILNLAYKKEISRDSYLISRYRDFYIHIGALISIFSGKRFNSNDNFQIDHLLPWSYYRVNRFWNLFPLEPDINREKSNYLPRLTEEIEKRIAHHLEACINNLDNSLIKNDLTYFYWILQKDFTFTIEECHADEVVEQLLVAIKKDLKNLRRIIPGKEYIKDTSSIKEGK